MREKKAISVSNGRGGYRSIIQQEFLSRKERNPAFSLRAFSRQLGVSKTALAEVLSSKRNLSLKNALKVAEKLSFSPDATKKMLTEIKGINTPLLDSNYHTLNEDSFNLISEWYYYAILNLAKLRKHKADARWIASRIGITPSDAHAALLRLQRMGFIEIKNNKICRNVGALNTTEGVPSAALRKYHRQNLHLALASLDRDSVSDRFNNSITMAIDSSRLVEAKKMFIKFRDRMCALLESESPDSVYTLAIQLFPIVRKENTK